MSRTIPFWLPEAGAAEVARLEAVIDSNYLNEGQVTVEFEQALARLLCVKHVVTATSGTGALFLALAGCGIGRGDEVLVPDITFIATANAVKLAGAEPVLVDVDPQTLTLSPEAAERAVTGRTKAILPVHVSGRAADLPALEQIARPHALTIIEDAAEALGSRAYGKYLGTIGRAGCFSLSPNKTISTGQGGFVATDDDQLAARMHELKDQGRPVRGTGGADVHTSLGFNFKFTNLQAAVGLAQLEQLPRRMLRLQETYRTYSARLAGVAGLRLLPFDVDDGACPQWVDTLVEQRAALDGYLRAQDIHCRPFWFPLHTQPPYRQPDALFPTAARLGPQALWLPSAFTLERSELETVCTQIRRFLEARV
jgi:perosamine synthetase